jgi:hypothetical protein
MSKPANRIASDGHVAAPEGEFDSFNLFDSCQLCRQPIRLAEDGAWVTMTSFNRECYGRTTC